MDLIQTNKMRLYLVILTTILFPLASECQQSNNADSIKNYLTENNIKTKPFHFISNVPDNIAQIFKYPFRKTHYKNFLITMGATAILVPFDIAVSKGVKHIAEQIHLSPETEYKVPIKFGKTNILKIPQNLNSALYQLGEGGTSMILAGGMYLYGKIKHDKAAEATASDLTETFFTMGITTQLIKRMSGRESPSPESILNKGGKLRPFTSIRNFQNNTSFYDAFPSGHLATMMATVTTMALNYPKKKWIKPVGYTLMSLTGFAMINNDVHWLSDYPLALALGYVSAKITYMKNHPKVHKVLSILY